MFAYLNRATLAAIVFIALALSAMAATEDDIGEGGLHTKSWFAETFRDVAEDIETAADEGKRLVLVFEQTGCIYCRKMHEELLTDPEVADFIKENFMVVQYNMFGDR